MEPENLNPQILQQPKPPGHSKKIAGILGIFLIITIIIGAIFYLKNSKPKVIQPPPKPALNKIEVSPDDKSIVNSETKKVIFTIEDAINYIKSSGIEINPDNQATYGGKCNGDCLVAAALSNRKGSIVFSAVWFPKGLASRPWIGVYNLPVECPAISDTTCQPSPSSFQFLMASNGINFAWSQDDKTITYDGGMDVYISPETRTIDANNGKLLEIKPPKGTTPGGNVYKNEKYGFELTFPDNWTSYNVSEDNGWVYKNLGFNYLSVLLRVNGNLVDLPSYQDIFAIGIFSENDWNERNTENNPVRFTYLAKNKDYYFGYVISKFSGNFVGVKSNNELLSEVKQALSTFKFIGQDKTNKLVQPTNKSNLQIH